MFDKQMEQSTQSNNAEELNISFQKKVFSFALSPTKIIDQPQQANACKPYLKQLIKENSRLQKELDIKNRQITKLRNTIKQKDLQIFYLNKVQNELKISLQNMKVYNQQFIGEIDLKNKEIQSLKSKKDMKQVLNSNEIYKLRSKYEILKQKYYSVKSQSRLLSRNITQQKRPISPKKGNLMNQIKDYVSTTKAKIRAQSKNKDYFVK